MTDDAVPMWVTTRTTAIRGICYAEGYRFASSDPIGMGARFSDILPANRAAEAWLHRDLRGPERPRWRATQRVQVDGKVFEAGREFHSDGWPRAGWDADNDAAESVLAYRREHERETLPSPAWVDGELNTAERDAARRAPPRPHVDDRPEYPFSGPIPKGAVGFRPRGEPSSFAASQSPSSVAFPPRTFARPR